MESKQKSQTLFVRACRLGAVAALVALAACGKKESSFSLLADSNTFKQANSSVNGKIDVLFVVDNSGSMASSQQALADNFARFIEKFDAKGFDYRLAVITSDAYKVQFGADPTMAKFRDGTDLTSHTGIFVVDPGTANVSQTFVTNVLQGIYGSGDERVFQSLETALESSENSAFGFPRADAFLSVILLSDEDDFSTDGAASIDSQYTNPALHTVQHYVDYLDAKMGATAANRSEKYNVNSIAILDQTCLDQLSQDANARKIGQRYIALSDATGGIKGSLCSDFGTTLSDISHKIIELRTRFKLQSEPNPSTIRVYIDGHEVPRIADGAPQPWSGFMYHADDNSISFHGDDYVPGPGSAISVTFDPNGLR